MPRYEILRELGRGGMGTVYLVRDQFLGRDVALKVLRGALPGAVERFVREARAMAALDHPTAVPIYTISRDGDDLYLTMEAVRGRTLREAFAAGDLKIAEAVSVLAEVARGVAYAHEKGFVHRDLKPSNVMLGEHGEVRVLDWGLVRAELAGRPEPAGDVLERSFSPRLTVAGAVMGTPAYLSPEQAEGLGRPIGPATDVYSLGAILYEILCGCPPFAGSLREILVRVMEGRFDPPSRRAPERRVSPDLERTCLRAMAIHPGHRHPSAGAFAEELEAWLARGRRK
ncbi:MAG: serine/threonine protein kinase [Planctomycetes bacterium]|nr:serine/threonine protein kinase [Planctomycetota bacterium]